MAVLRNINNKNHKAQEVPQQRPGQQEIDGKQSVNETGEENEITANFQPITVRDLRVLLADGIESENKKVWSHLVESGILNPRQMTDDEAKEALHDWLDSKPDTTYTREGLQRMEVIAISNKTATSEIVEKRWAVIRSLEDFDGQPSGVFMDHIQPATIYEANIIACPRCGPAMDLDPTLELFCIDCKNHRSVWMLKLATYDKKAYVDDRILNESAEEAEQQELRSFLTEDIKMENVLFHYQKQFYPYAINQCVDMQTTISKTSYYKVAVRMTDGEQQNFVLFGDEDESFVMPDNA